MAVAISGAIGNHNFTSSFVANTAQTTAYNCPSGTNCLVILEASTANNNAPSALTWHGTSLTMVPSSLINDSTQPTQTSIWYILNPQIGSQTISLTYTVGVTGGVGLSFIPLSGVNTLAPVGTAVTASSTGATSASITPAAATANDLYLDTICTADNPTTVTVGTGTQQQNFNSRSTIICANSTLAGNGGSPSWTMSVSSSYAHAAVAFLSSVSFVPQAPLSQGGYNVQVAQ